MACFLYPGGIIEAENPRPELMMAKVSKERGREREKQTDRKAERQRETECNEYISCLTRKLQDSSIPLPFLHGVLKETCNFVARLIYY